MSKMLVYIICTSYYSGTREIQISHMLKLILDFLISLSRIRENTGAILCSHKSGNISHTFMCWRTRRRSSIELSNNISGRRCELKSNEPVSEGSERGSGYITDLLLAWWRSKTVSGKSVLYFIIVVGWPFQEGNVKGNFPSNFDVVARCLTISMGPSSEACSVNDA